MSPTDSQPMAWTWAPLAGSGGGALIGGLWAVAAPSEHPMRTIILGSTVGAGLGLTLGYVLSRRHLGAIYPSPPLAPRTSPMLTLGGHC